MTPATPPLFAVLRAFPEWLDTLTPAELAVLPYMHDLWLRPDQRVPGHNWRGCGAVAGRGYGKSLGVAVEINRRAESGVRAFNLMAPTEDRADKIQIQTLIDVAPPWFRPERFRDGLTWPNGARANVFTAEKPEGPRGENCDTSWLSEIVAWASASRREAYNHITTATRIGHAQFFWDTTSQGANEVIALLMSLHEQDPRMYPMIRGSTFDNPLLTRKYILDECRKYSGQRFLEEIMGQIFAEGEGAMFRAAWIERARVDAAPSPRDTDLVLVSIDPALSKDGDEIGLCVGARDKSRAAYLLDDRSGHYTPEEWGDIAVSECIDRAAAGCVIERNHLGDNATYVLRSRAQARKLTVRVLGAHDAFPRFTRGVMYVRERVARESKIRRADGPASEVELGNVHHVGLFPALEKQLLSYDGSGRSPNRFDAYTQLVTELRELDREARPSPEQNTAAAVKAHATIRDQLRAIDAGRVI